MSFFKLFPDSCVRVCLFVSDHFVWYEQTNTATNIQRRINKYSKFVHYLPLWSCSASPSALYSIKALAMSKCSRFENMNKDYFNSSFLILKINTNLCEEPREVPYDCHCSRRSYLLHFREVSEVLLYNLNGQNKYRTYSI